MTCKNCNSEINSKFCPECGQPSDLKRIDGKYIVHEIAQVLNFDRGILFTIRELITNPGQNVQNYLRENRSRLVKPIIFIIVTSLIYSITISYFHIEEQYVQFQDEAGKSTAKKIFQWIQDNYGYANILMGFFIVFWLKVFFRKQEYNFFEILVLLCFIMGIAMLINAVFAMLQGVTGFKVSQVGGIVAVIYCSWAIGQFFGKEKYINYVKALFAYLLGLISFVVVSISGGILFDLVNK